MERKLDRGQISAKQGQIEGYRPRVVVKFRDYVELPYQDGVEAYFEKLRIGPWERIAKEFPGATMRRMYTAVDPAKIKELVRRAVEADQTYRPPNFLTYFVVDCPTGADPQALAKAFREWPNVQTAYFDLPGEDPSPVNDADDPLCPNQLYLDPAPTGVNAHYAWGFLGGDGEGQRVIDLEQGWTLNHEDLAGHGATVLYGTVRDTSRYHGTAVLGEICACDNTLGCVGIAPHVAGVNVVSYYGVGNTIPNAIMTAIVNLSFGDTLLLEVQVGFLPAETQDAEFEAIRLATALGLIVVEAAGNGAFDLDAYTNALGQHILQRGHADFRESGAVMVGACNAVTPHTRWTWSNHGSRVDCYGWGEQVDTLSSDDTGSTTLYTTTFQGTSSASPIVAGCVLVVQGIAEHNLGHRFSPHQMRALLSDPANGTASATPATDLIGVMPNLRAIIDSNAIGLAPDIYIRDNVGDTGNPHLGSISSSPDIILVPAEVPDPQAAYGQGSGTENSVTLCQDAHPGHDNFVYVRVRNRGGSVATGVDCQVFWSPVASLVTPDLWTDVGNATIPSVPTGDILTVSPSIRWHQADIPPAGHYCYVGLVGNGRDPAPTPADFATWDNFYRFIRDNNNVTWRNFNVAGSDPDPAADPAGYVALPFLVVGPHDMAREMAVEVAPRLPKGSKAMFEAPLYLRGLVARVARPVLEKKRNLVRVPVNPYGPTVFGPMLLKAKLRAPCRLLVAIPKELRGGEYEVFARQLFRKQEVGRVTWRLVPNAKLKETR